MPVAGTNSAYATENMIIKYNGYVGIGTALPDETSRFMAAPVMERDYWSWPVEGLAKLRRE
jgi:hypothetical protein